MCVCEHACVWCVSMSSVSFLVVVVIVGKRVCIVDIVLPGSTFKIFECDCWRYSSQVLFMDKSVSESLLQQKCIF